MLRIVIVLAWATSFGLAIAQEVSTDLIPSSDLQRLIERIKPSVATIRVLGRDGDQIGMGTGFVIDADGLIATNLHVINEGRPFSVEMPSGRKLKVLSIQSSDRLNDLSIIRVDPEGHPFKALPLSQAELPAQGTRVIAFGNPLGMRDSVVTGIVSAKREIEGNEMIQVAIPTQPGNSGGPLVDTAGKVVGIMNMKSAIDDNLGFAIPIQRLQVVRDNPNPVTYQRWVQLRRLNEERWTPVFGSSWQQRGGTISARGLGSGFGGRALCLSTELPPEEAFEVAVNVRLDDESGAAGIAFHSDGNDRHYGFYPSAGQLRLTCFKGPSVYDWEILEETPSEHYLPNEWNHLRVRIEPGRLQCFVNDQLVIESNDHQLSTGKFGLVKFRDTNPDFKGFRYGDALQNDALDEDAAELLDRIFRQPQELERLSPADVDQLGNAGVAAGRAITKQISELEKQTAQLRRLAADVQLQPTLSEFKSTVGKESEDRLLRGSLLIAKLDDPDIDVEAYLTRINEMAEEISEDLQEEADAVAIREALHRFLFDENGYHGGQAEYYHRANSYLNRVIDDREGLPITLSILYMELGRRIGLQLDGIGLPGHFVVEQTLTNGEQQLIDVFDRGKVLSDAEAEQLVLANTGRRMQPFDRRAQSENEILQRVLNNLIGVAGREQDPEAIHRYCEALVCIDPESITARRMRSQIRIMTNRNAAAIRDLDWLIENDTAGFAQAEAMRLRQSVLERTESQ